jgi:hypothetical protein
MKREAPESRPWPIVRSAAAGPAYDDPVRIRRWPMSRPVRPPARTFLVHGERFVDEAARVSSS